MKTLQEKYNAILEGKFSKAQFVRDARMELPNLITQFNGFEDTTTILKNRGMIFEAKKVEVKEYDKPAPGYSIETLERAVDYEIEGMGLQSQETVSEEDYAKAKAKAEKNLDKDPNHYLHLLSGDSKKVDKHDKYVEVKKNNHVDTFNGMKKAELKEGVVEKAMSKGYTREQVEEALARLKEKKGKDLDGDGDIDGDDYMAAKDQAIKKAMGKKVDEIGMFHDPIGYDSNAAAEDKRALEFIKSLIEKGVDKDSAIEKAGEKFRLRTSYLQKKMSRDPREEQLKEGENNFKEGDKVSVFMRGTKADGPEEVTIVAMDPSGVAIVKNAEGREDEVFTKDMQPVQEINEGRRKKTQGGKIVTENDYETGGYVESMGPMFDKAVSGLVAAFTDWKEGPMTEPGMIPHAKKDVVTYIDNQLEQSLTEDHSDNPNDKYVVRPCKNKKEPWAVWEGETRVKGFATKEEAKAFADNKNKEQGLNEAQLKEAFKGIITNILKEEVITEAATGNLANIADTYNDFEGMQSAVNALENIVTDVESYYAKTKEKIQKVYDSFNNIKNPEGIVMGALIGPAIESAFKKDLIPVASKGFTEGLKLPQVKMLKPGDVQEEELEEKATVFTPINETRKRKYTKSKK